MHYSYEVWKENVRRFSHTYKKKKNCDKAINKFGDRNHETGIGYLELVNYFQLLINKEISM